MKQAQTPSPARIWMCDISCLFLDTGESETNNRNEHLMTVSSSSVIRALDRARICSLTVHNMTVSIAAASSTVDRETQRPLTGMQLWEANIWAQHLQRSVGAVLSEATQCWSQHGNARHQVTNVTGDISGAQGTDTTFSRVSSEAVTGFQKHWCFAANLRSNWKSCIHLGNHFIECAMKWTLAKLSFCHFRSYGIIDQTALCLSCLLKT